MSDQDLVKISGDPADGDTQESVEARAATVKRVEADDPAVVTVCWMCGSDAEVVALCAALKGNTHVQMLDLGLNRELTQVAFQAVLDAVPNCSLEQLDAEGCGGISEHLEQAIKTAIEARITARIDQMSAEELARTSGDTSDSQMQNSMETRFATVARVQADDPAVVEVSWGFTHPSDDEVVALCAALEENTHVRMLDLRFNDKLTEPTFQALLEAVPKSHLGTVNVDGCDGISQEREQAIHVAVAARIAARIAEMSPQELAKTSGDPGDNCTQVLAVARAATIARVQTNDSAVVTVNWAEADPSDADVVALCAALDGNTHVQALLMQDNNNLTEAAFQALLEAVSKSRLESVDVEGCYGISDELEQAIAAAPGAAAAARVARMSAQDKNLAQTSGDPADNHTQVSVETRAATIARVQADDPAVVRVNWKGVQPPDLDVIALCAALDGNTHVQTLDLHSNKQLTEPAFQALLEVVPKSCLKKVHVANCPGASDRVKGLIAVQCKLRGWTPTNLLVDADETLARSVAEQGHPIMTTFLQEKVFANKTVAEFLRFLTGEAGKASDETETMLDLAMTSPFPEVKAWAKSYGNLQPQKGTGVCFRIIGMKVHGSETCIVIFAEDVMTKHRVALKLMANRDEWQREQTMRLVDRGQKLDPSHVVEILDCFELDDDAMNFCASHEELRGNSRPVPAELLELKRTVSAVLSATTDELESKLKAFDEAKNGRIDHQKFRMGMKELAPEITDDQLAELHTCLDNKHGTLDYQEFSHWFGRYAYPFMITMPAAAMDLTYMLSHDRVAGNDLESVLDIIRQIGEHTMYMHEMLHRVHGDLKPRNIVKAIVAGKASWVLIDLDASCRLGELAGQKVTSSAFFPPEMARRELDKLNYRPQSVVEIVLASKQFEMWYLGLLLLQLSTVDAPTLWQSTQADNILEADDMQSLAYFWDTLKLQKVGKITGKKWTPAADLSLWLLQEKPSRRPESMEQVFAHMFFNPNGNLHCFESIEETMEGLVQRQTKALMTAINDGNTSTVQELFDRGGVHLKMADSIIRSAFVGHVDVTRVLLNEINDSWPQEIRQDYLDQRTSLGLTAYMIACACGHNEIASMLEAKGCAIGLRDASGKTGRDHAMAAVRERDQAALTPFNHAHEMWRSCTTLEQYLVLRESQLNEHLDAGLKVWHAKQFVGHLSADELDELRLVILDQMQKANEVSLHFTDLDSARVILHSLGIRASRSGQLGGGVSLCMQTLADFGWKDGKDGVSFAKAIGVALWGSMHHEVLPMSERPLDAHEDFGKYSKKLECALVVSIPNTDHRDPHRILPERESVYIAPHTDCLPGSLLDENDTDRYLSNTHIRALFILKQAENQVDGDATRIQITSTRDDNGAMMGVQMTAIDEGARLSDTLDASSGLPKTLSCAATLAKPVARREVVLLQHRARAKDGTGKNTTWPENVSRFKSAEMNAGIFAVDQQLLHCYTMAFFYTTAVSASKICQDSHGIPCTVDADGNCSITLCLKSPSELGWQKNASGDFKDNVANVVGIECDDVQAMIIVGVPTDTILRAGCEGADTFTITAQVNLLEESVDGQVVYSNAHIVKVYELEPAPLLEARQNLAIAHAEDGVGNRDIKLGVLSHKLKQLKKRYASERGSNDIGDGGEYPDEVLAANGNPLVVDGKVDASVTHSKLPSELAAMRAELQREKAASAAKDEELAGALVAKVAQSLLSKRNMRKAEEAQAELRSLTEHVEEFEAVSIAEFKRIEAEQGAAVDQLAAKDEQLAAKEEQLSAKDDELQQLRAQLARLEGVPPQ